MKVILCSQLDIIGSVPGNSGSKKTKRKSSLMDELTDVINILTTCDDKGNIYAKPTGNQMTS